MTQKQFKFIVCAVLAFFIFLNVNLSAKPRIPLKKQLWTFVKDCNSQIMEQYDDSKPDIKVVDDTRNGYLNISGTWPTCGCGCAMSAGAYRKSSGDYLLLKNESWSCSQTAGISASESFKDIFPIGFGLNTYTDESINLQGTSVFFYLRVNIPRIGTKTEISLENIPFGMTAKCTGNICYNLKTSKINYKYKNYLKELASELKRKETLQWILEDYIQSGSTKELVEFTIIKKHINPNICYGEKCDPMLTLQNDIKYIYQHYKIYKKIKYKSIILQWNRKEGRFEIFKKNKKSHNLNFLEFLKSLRFWQPTC